MLLKDDFVKILSDYSIGSYKSHKAVKAPWGKVLSANYLLQTTKGRFILKVENLTLRKVKFQNRLMNHLHSNGVSVQRVYSNKYDSTFLKYEGKIITIKDYFTGCNPKSFNKKLAISSASALSLMHEALLKLQCEGDSLRKTIIHGDLSEVNVLVSNDKLTGIIDWEDARVDYLASDLGYFIVGCLINLSKNYKVLISLFMRKYQERLKLTREEREHAYNFIKSKLKKNSWLAWAVPGFNNISLEEFLKY